MNGPHNLKRSDIYMHVADGGVYHPFDPRPEEISLEVIAHHLACNGRWNGATRHLRDPERIFYSVAEHSVYVSFFVEEHLARPDLALCALLHDAAEAYIGDLIRPLKYSAEFHEPFKAVEELNERAIARKFGLPFPFPPEIKTADEAVCHAEFEQIVPRKRGLDWGGGLAKLHDDRLTAPYRIEMMAPAEAFDFFMARFQQIEVDLGPQLQGEAA